jgi:hypothetical protein
LAFAERAQRHDGEETAMKQSTTRILTTHTGRLPRLPNLVSLLIEEQTWSDENICWLVSMAGLAPSPGEFG